MLFPLYLSREKQGTLVVPYIMNKEEWDLLELQVKHSLAIAKATALAEDEPTEPD